MYTVSDAYKAAIEQDYQDWKIEVRVRYANGEQKVFDDDTIMGDVTVESQMMSGGANEDVIDIGAVPAKTASLTLIDDSADLHRYSGARFAIYPMLRLASGEYEKIPMGAFFVDPSKLSRFDNRISIVGYDGMLSFQYVIKDDQRVALKGMAATEAAQLLAAYSACGFEQDLSELPNGTIPLNFDSPQIVTAWDGIMWIAQIMGCFGRIDRTNHLEFVPIMSKWEYFNDEHTVGTIIAARNIGEDQRYDDIEFTDDRIHIVGVAMEGDDSKLVTRGGGGLVDDANITITLEKNPIIEGCGKPLESILDDILAQLGTAYFYAFRAGIKNDPALDAGDVIRLQGGRINGTNKNNDLIGFITHSTWTYRGQQNITNVGQVPIVYRDTPTAAVVALSVDEDGIAPMSETRAADELFSVAPVPQSQKVIKGGGKSDRLVAAEGGWVLRLYKSENAGSAWLELVNIDWGDGYVLASAEVASLLSLVKTVNEIALIVAELNKSSKGDRLIYPLNKNLIVRFSASEKSVVIGNDSGTIHAKKIIENSFTFQDEGKSGESRSCKLDLSSDCVRLQSYDLDAIKFQVGSGDVKLYDTRTNRGLSFSNQGAVRLHNGFDNDRPVYIVLNFNTYTQKLEISAQREETDGTMTVLDEIGG